MMQLKSYTLLERVKDDFGDIPVGFLDDLPEGKSFVYLTSCHDSRMIFMEPSPKQVTGFTVEEMMAGGIDMQISRIHPDDLAGLYDKALRIIRKNGTAAQHGGRITPLTLEYRIRRADGKWRVVRETKLFSYCKDGSHDRVLGKLVDVTERAANDRYEAEQFLADPRNEYPILDALYKFKKNTEKQPIVPSAEAAIVMPAGIRALTRRERKSYS